MIFYTLNYKPQIYPNVKEFWCQKSSWEVGASSHEKHGNGEPSGWLNEADKKYHIRWKRKERGT